MIYPSHPNVENLLVYYHDLYKICLADAGKKVSIPPDWEEKRSWQEANKIQKHEGVWVYPPCNLPDTKFTNPTLEWWEKFIDECVTQDLKALFQRNACIRRKLRETGAVEYRFVTCGFSNEISPKEFVEKWRLIEEGKWVWGDDRITRFEFYRENGKYHPHVHMFIYTNKKSSHIIRELAKKTGLAKNYIDVKSGRSLTHLNYIKGIKRESKQEDMDRDRKVRETLGIEEYEYSEKLNLEKI